MVKEIKEKREKDKEEKLREENEKYERKMKYIQNTHDKLRQEKLHKIIEERSKYSNDEARGGVKRNTQLSRGSGLSLKD